MNKTRLDEHADDECRAHVAMVERGCVWLERFLEAAESRKTHP